MRTLTPGPWAAGSWQPARSSRFLSHLCPGCLALSLAISVIFLSRDPVRAVHGWLVQAPWGAEPLCRWLPGVGSRGAQPGIGWLAGHFPFVLWGAELNSVRAPGPWCVVLWRRVQEASDLWGGGWERPGCVCGEGMSNDRSFLGRSVQLSLRLGPAFFNLLVALA